MPDPIVEAGTSNDSATGGNESPITLGKRAAESEASNDSANDQVSQKGDFWAVCVTFLEPRGLKSRSYDIGPPPQLPNSPFFYCVLRIMDHMGSSCPTVADVCR